MTVLRRIRAARGGAAVVVTYHRVHEPRLDPQRLAVTPERFEEHIRAYARRYTPMTAGELFTHLAEKTPLPRNALVVTIDDGYADVFTHARPILERHGVAATVFVSSGFVGSESELWWDELSRVCFSPGVLPGRIDLAEAGVDFVRELDAGARLDEADARLFAGWDVTSPATHPRQQLYLDLAALLHPLGAQQRQRVLEELRRQAGVTEGVREHNRGMTRDEVESLAHGGLIEIGAHTVNHQSLAGRSPTEQLAEIENSKRALEEITKRPVVSFSYPYGTQDSFTEKTQEIVRAAGFVGACTTELGRRLPWGSVSLRTDRYAVPRTASADVSAAEMTALIDKRLGL